MTLILVIPAIIIILAVANGVNQYRRASRDIARALSDLATTRGDHGL